MLWLLLQYLHLPYVVAPLMWHVQVIVAIILWFYNVNLLKAQLKKFLGCFVTRYFRNYILYINNRSFVMIQCKFRVKKETLVCLTAPPSIRLHMVGCIDVNISQASDILFCLWTFFSSLKTGGGTGFVGQNLLRLLREKGYKGIAVSRKAGRGKLTWVFC